MQCFVMVVSICMNICNEIAIEKNITLNQAMEFLFNSIIDARDEIFEATSPRGGIH